MIPRLSIDARSTAQESLLRERNAKEADKAIQVNPNELVTTLFKFLNFYRMNKSEEYPSIK